MSKTLDYISQPSLDLEALLAIEDAHIAQDGFELLGD